MAIVRCRETSGWMNELIGVVIDGAELKQCKHMGRNGEEGDKVIDCTLIGVPTKRWCCTEHDHEENNVDGADEMPCYIEVGDGKAVDVRLPEGERGGASTFSTPLGADRHSSSASSFVSTMVPN